MRRGARPNGSAKSTFVSCLLRAMEDYSAQPEGALYRFNWVFPKARGRDGTRIGFGGLTDGEGGPKPGESFAHLDEAAIDAKVPSEVPPQISLHCLSNRSLSNHRQTPTRSFT